MDKPFLSIIMPVYKAEKYLSKSVDCVLTQTQNFRLICKRRFRPPRGDGDDYAKKDNRVSVIHLPGGGKRARNAAIRAKEGI